MNLEEQQLETNLKGYRVNLSNFILQQLIKHFISLVIIFFHSKDKLY